MKLVSENVFTVEYVFKIWNNIINNYKINFREWNEMMKNKGRFKNSINDIEWIKSMSKLQRAELILEMDRFKK